MQTISPFSTNGKKVKLLVMDAKEELPSAFALMGTLARNKVALRITGGCKGMSESDKDNMLDFFADAFQGYQGLVWSGATRQVNAKGYVDPMVTDIPGIIASENEGCVALGTVPRTDIMSLQDDSRLVLDEYGTAPNPNLSGILIVQKGADGKLDWNGDLDAYFSLMQNWQQYAGFSRLGLCSWNGGAVTEEEIIKAISLHWPVILVRGSGRVTDEIVKKIENHDEKFISQFSKGIDQVVVVDHDKSQDLQKVLKEKGFLN